MFCLAYRFSDSYLLGLPDGFCESLAVSWLLGLADCLCDSSVVSLLVGLADGFLDGYSDGFLLGFEDGYLDGSRAFEGSIWINQMEDPPFTLD
jgi:hypothetical protein